jgi:protein SCO1/2
MKVLLIVILFGGVAAAQPAPGPVLAAGVDEHLGAQLPLDTPFLAARGGATTLRPLFDGAHPVLLVIAYARCTMLCNVVLRATAEAARALAGNGRVAGRDYRLVVVSLDARETIDEARRQDTVLLARIGATDPGAWPYLLGTRASIDAVANAVGFRYAWDPRTEQYAHPAVIFAVTPQGRVARYLHGVQFEPAEVAAALDDAAAGRLVSEKAAAVLRCFHFDPALRRAGARVQLFLRIGAATIFVALLALLAGLVGWERRRGRLP